MLNPEVNLRTSAEICSQIASYFDVVDNCVAVSDTNKQYSINPQTSYSPSPPIKAGSYTSVIISPNTHNTADIYNGFIRADLFVKLRIKDAAAMDTITINDKYYFNKIWFGFKDARDAIEKYEIVANGITIYTQNFGCEESFLTSCCSSEDSKRADIQSKTRHKDVWKGKKRCGVIFNWTNGETAEGTIKLKIDLRRFLPLSNIKYLPAFAGKIELRLYFSCAGMVCCPCGPDPEFLNDRRFSNIKFDQITNEFSPVGEPIFIYTTANTDYKKDTTTKPVQNQIEKPVAGELPSNGTLLEEKETEDSATILEDPAPIRSHKRTFIVDDYEVRECSSIIPCFGIDQNVYTGLVQRYSNPEHPLTFPTQTLSIYTCTSPLKNTDDKCTITITPRFVDSIFLLFPLKHTHRTYFKNPHFTSFQLNCGGYGNIPAKPFSTCGDKPEFLEYCQNAMNLNGDQIGFNKEVIDSLRNTDEPYSSRFGRCPRDRTSFFIGLPTETDGTYQQDLTSLAPINFEIMITQKDGPNSFAKNTNTPPLMCLLYDSSISILVQPNGMPPLVRIGNYDITTPE